MQKELWANNLKLSLHVALMGAPIGFLVGAAIAGYDYVVNTLLWGQFKSFLEPWQLCVLPCFGMLLTGLILQIFKVPSSAMADEIVRAYHNPKDGLDVRRVFPKLAASITTMGFGCSAGMEGASKWLGGTIAYFAQKIANRWPRASVLHGRIETTMLAGAAAGIAAIFRAPLTGAIMGIESPFKKDLAHDALIHGLIASAVSYVTFVSLRDAGPLFPITFHYRIHGRDLLLCIPLGIAAGLSSHIFLSLLAKLKTFSSRFPRFRLLPFLLGGILLSGIAFALKGILGEAVSLHSGQTVVHGLQDGQYGAFACALIFAGKLLATAITFGMGGVGGLFFPSATIGAALGAFCDIIFHPAQPGVFTLVGIAAFTGASYNSLLFAVVFIAEASGNPALVVPGLIASCAAYVVAAGVSNSPSQKQERTEESLPAAGTISN